jgi:hypothetical protein
MLPPPLTILLHSDSHHPSKATETRVTFGFPVFDEDRFLEGVMRSLLRSLRSDLRNAIRDALRSLSG